MDIQEIYSNLLEINEGNKYYKCDLHLHFYPEDQSEDGIKDYCSKLFNILKRNEINLIGLTVHREEFLDYLFRGIHFLNEHSIQENYDLHIFPAIEIKDVRNTHFTIIFSKDIQKNDILKFLGGINKKINQNDPINMDKCDQIDQDIASSKSTVKDALSNYNGIAFFPHPFTEKTGIVKTIGGESFKNYVKDPLTYLWNIATPSETSMDISTKSSDCPKDFFPTEIRFKTDEHFKDIARIKISDAHEIDELDKIYSKCPECNLFEFCNKGYAFLKLSTPSILALKQIGYDYKSRVMFKLDKIFNYPHILGLYVKSNFFKDKYFRFNLELNVLIGGRGVGKSLLIDLIRFVYNSIPDEEDEYYSIFHDKIKEQLGNGGKVIIFHKKDDDHIFAIERRLVLIDESKEIDWERDTELLFYEKHKDHPFYTIQTIENLRSFIEGLSQTEIPSIHIKTKSLLSLIDAFIDDFIEKHKRKDKIKNLDNIAEELKELYYKYENLEQIQYKISNKLRDLEVKNEYLENLKQLDLKTYQKYIELNDRISKIPENINYWLSEVERIIKKQPDIDIFIDINKIISKEIKDHIKEYEEVKAKIQEIGNEFLNKIQIAQNEFKISYKKFHEIWTNFYQNKYNEYKDFIKDKDIDFVERVQNEITRLNIDIENLKSQLKEFDSIRQKIEEKEKRIIKIAEEINQLTNVIDKKRRNAITEIRRKLNKHDINLTVRLKKIKKYKEYKEFLLKVHSTQLIEIINRIQNDFKPYYLGIAILKNQLENYSKKFDKKRRKIFEKLNDLIENSTHPLIFKNLKIIELFKLFIDKKPIISFRRGPSGQYTILDKLSIGERCAVILFIMLLEKNKPLLIDQADAELDQDSIKRFSTYLLSMKKNRQVIVATHNANIPVLGDVDLLYHLNTEPSEVEERELGVITNSSGFEDSIEDLLILEGGKDAIIKRFKKYDWKIL